MSNQIQSESRSSVLENEVNDLQAELQQLQSKRDELARRPVFAQDAPAAEVAQRIVSVVSQNAGSMRALDGAIAILMERLTSKRSLLQTTKQQEHKESATEKLAELHEQAIEHCERVNQISELLEQEVAKLRKLEAEIAPVRLAAYGMQYSYRYLSVDENATVLEAGWSTVGVHVGLRPLRSV